MMRVMVLILLSAVLSLGCGSGGDSGASLLPVISRGDRVDLSQHVEEEGYTLFVFGAQW